MSTHLVVTPILIPLLAGALLLLVGPRWRRLEPALAILSPLLLLLNALALVALTDGEAGPVAQAYRLGDWPAAFAIVLVADRLSALMLLLASVLGLAGTIFALGRWSRLGPYYAALSQFLLMGLNGAFLTGDLFNLFVFFEVLLAASYGLLLHGSGAQRVSAGLHYIVINLAASLLFLVGVSLIFGVMGTLNMAELALRAPGAPPHTRSLLHAGAAILGIAFLTKAAAWPLGFWLPRTYDAAAPPVAAMFAIMTKVGVYALLRLGVLFGADAGTSAGFGRGWVFGAGVLTMAAGMVGVLAVRDLGRLGGYNLVISAGALLAAAALGDPDVTAGALLYLGVSTLGAATLFLLAGIVAAERGDGFEAGVALDAEDPADDARYGAAEERTVLIAAPVGLLSGAYLAVTLLVAGLPPLPGFFAKVAILSRLVARPDGAGAVLAVLLLVSSLVVLVALVRAGIQIWWVEADKAPVAIRATELAPVAGLLLAGLALTVAIEGPLAFANRTAAQLGDPAQYIRTVLGEGASP